MNIHEHQAKKILKKYGAEVPKGIFALSVDELIEKAKSLNTEKFVLKAQIHAGGRGKGGGVKYSKDSSSALENCKEILGMNLVTHQTGPGGKKVNKVLITEAYDIKKEYYVAITLDRAKKKDVFMVSSEGGVNIEDVAKNAPEKIIKVWIDPMKTLNDSQTTKLGNGLGFTGDLLVNSNDIFKKLYKCCQEMDCTILEVNPLITTADNRIIALDAKLNFDGNSLFRQQDVLNMRDTTEEDPMELEANQYNLNYINEVFRLPVTSTICFCCTHSSTTAYKNIKLLGKNFNFCNLF